MISATAQDLAALLADHPHVLIIEDDHFWQVSNHSYRSIIPANHPRWALVRSVSKSLGPDLRVGLVGSDKLTASRLGSHIRSGAMWVSHLLQRLTYLLITHPDTPAQLAEAAQEYAHANAQLIDALVASKISAASLTVSTCGSTFATGLHLLLTPWLHAAGWYAMVQNSLSTAPTTP